VVSHFTYGIVSDGDLMEASPSEAAALAGPFEIGQIDLSVRQQPHFASCLNGIDFHEDCAKRVRGFMAGTRKQSRMAMTSKRSTARCALRARNARPSLILARTHIGLRIAGQADTFEAQGAPLGEEEVKLDEQKLGWPAEPPFFIPDRGRAGRIFAICDKGTTAEAGMEERFSAYVRKFPPWPATIEHACGGDCPRGWEESLPDFPATRRGWRPASPREKFSMPSAPSSDIDRRSADLIHPTHPRPAKTWATLTSPDENVR